MADTKLPVGRGRGRGRGAYKRQTEPKPGVVETTTVADTKIVGENVPAHPLQDTKTVGKTIPARPLQDTKTVPTRTHGSTLNELSYAINAMPLHPADKDMNNVVEMAKKIPWTEDNLNELFQVFYQRCSKDWRFSEHAAEMCNILDGDITDSQKLRKCMLISLKKDNDDADKIREESNSRFLSLVSLLCQMFAKFRIHGEPMQILPVPVTKLLKISLDDSASDDELECAATQLLAMGSLLQPYVDASHWNEIRNSIKAAIIADRGSAETKLKLIQVIEGIASNWQY